jgi:transcription elongation factor Elf1
MLDLAKSAAKEGDAAMAKPGSHLFECPHCGSLYSINCVPTLGRDTGTAHCVVCKKSMRSWTATKQIPILVLLEQQSESEAARLVVASRGRA